MNILVAGAGGVLGRELVSVLHQKGIPVTGLGYSEKEFFGLKDKLREVFCLDVTRPEKLKSLCRSVDIVISTIGITRIKGNLTHMAVDFQGNLNLLREAQAAGVKKFVFISPAGTDEGQDYVPLFRAKYLFEEELKKSGISWLIFRSGGFFSDLAAFCGFAEKGSMFVIGDGKSRFTPIDVKELARIMVEDTLVKENQVVSVGGPEDVSWRHICEMCFAVAGKKPKIISVPVWICRLTLFLLKPFSPKYFAMGRLLLFTSTHDLTTNKRGSLKLSDYLKGCKRA